VACRRWRCRCRVDNERAMLNVVAVDVAEVRECPRRVRGVGEGRGRGLTRKRIRPSVPRIVRMAVVHIDDELVRRRVVREQLERDYVALIDRQGRPGLRDVVWAPPPARGGGEACIQRDGYGLLRRGSYRGTRAPARG